MTNQNEIDDSESHSVSFNLRKRKISNDLTPSSIKKENDEEENVVVYKRKNSHAKINKIDTEKEVTFIKNY